MLTIASGSDTDIGGDNGDTLTFGGAGTIIVQKSIGIGRTLGIAKEGTGTTVLLSSSNTYSGATRLGAGTLQVGNGGSAGTIGSGGITLEGGTLAFLRSGSLSLPNALTIPAGRTATILNDGPGLVTFSGADAIAAGAAELVLGGSGSGVITKALASVSGTLPLTKVGSGTWTLTNASTNYTGPTTVRGGMLEVTGRLGAGTYGSPVLLDGGDLYVNSASAQVLSGTISGGGQLRKGGSGTLTLTGSNTFASDVVVDAGRLVGSVASLPTSIANDGTVEFSQATTGTYARIVGGTGSFVKSSAGTLVLAGNNTYSGSTTISSGTLQVGVGGTAGTLGTGDVVINGALRYQRSDDVTLDRDYSGTGSLIQAGTGTLTLTATNTYTYTGGTVLMSGKLVLTSSNRLADAGVLTVSDAEVDLGGFTDTVGVVTLSSGTIAHGSLTGSRYDVASGLVSASLGGAVAFNKTTTGTVILSASNSFSGATTLDGGVVRLVDGGAISPNTAISLNDGFVEITKSTDSIIINSIDALDGTLGDVPGVINNGTGLLTIGLGTATNIYVDSGEPLLLGGSGNMVIEKSIATFGNASLITKVGSGTVTLISAGNKWSGGTTVSEGVLQVGNGVADGTVGTGTITLTNGRLAFNRATTYTVSEKIAPFLAATTPGIDTNGSGTITLNATSLTFQAGATLTLGGTGTGILNGAIGAAGESAAIVKDGAGIWSFNASNGYSGPTTINGGTLAIVTPGRLGGGTSGTGNYAAPIALNAGVFHYNSTSPQTLSGGVSGAGNLLKSATSTLTIAAATTFTGTTRVAGGRLDLAHVDALAGSMLDLDAADSGTVQFAMPGIHTYSIGGLRGSRNLALGGNTASVGGNNVSTTYSGMLSGSGGFTKVGSGALTLSGTGSHTGGTAVTAGVARINGNWSAATGPVSVAAGAVFGGTGTLGSSVTIAGIHAPGNSPGVQTILGHLTYTVGSAVEWELVANTDTAAGTYDQVVLPTGNLVVAGTTALDLAFDSAGSVVNWSNGFWASNHAWTIYDLGSGTATGIDQLTIAPQSWLDRLGTPLASTRPWASFGVASQGADVVLTYAAIPEPASVGVTSTVAAVLVGLLVRRRRSRA